MGGVVGVAEGGVVGGVVGGADGGVVGGAEVSGLQCVLANLCMAELPMKKQAEGYSDRATPFRPAGCCQGKPLTTPPSAHAHTHPHPHTSTHAHPPPHTSTHAHPPPPPPTPTHKHTST